MFAKSLTSSTSTIVTSYNTPEKELRSTLKKGLPLKDGLNQENQAKGVIYLYLQSRGGDIPVNEIYETFKDTFEKKQIYDGIQELTADAKIIHVFVQIKHVDKNNSLEAVDRLFINEHGSACPVTVTLSNGYKVNFESSSIAKTTYYIDIDGNSIIAYISKDVPEED